MLVLFANKLLKLIGKILPKKEYRYVAKVSEEDAVRNINYLAHSLRKVSRKGIGISLFPVFFAIRQGYRTVLLKEKKGVDIFGFERWLKENYRLLNGKMSEVKGTDFLSLPHVDGVPRIVIVAEYLVHCSGGDLDRGRTESIVKAFNSITPLTFVELRALRAAIAYVLLREIAQFAERAATYYSSYLSARKGRCAHSDRDSYRYFYELLHADDKETISEEGDSARLAFENILAANEKLMGVYVDSLRNIDTHLTEDSAVRLSKVNDVYVADESYRMMSHIAKRDYLSETGRIAEMYKTTEIAVANAVMTLAKENGRHFGNILYKQKDAVRILLRSGRIVPLRNEIKKVQGAYCAAGLLIALILAAFPAYYLRNVAAYCAVLPIFILALHPVEYFLKRFLSLRKREKPLPEMDYASLPDACGTVVVVSRFIRDRADVDDAVLQIETLAASFTDPKVRYAVVADLPSSEDEWTEKDEDLLDYIRECRLTKSVGFFLRKRVRKDGKWVAYERKRGALLEYLSAVISGDYSRFFSVGKQGSACYAVLLDDDSELLPGTLRSVISAMAHPLNEEYDLLSFGGKVNRYSLDTYYSEKYARSCGIDAYPFYSDFYSDRFDCALYCGKAIVRIEPYLRKLKSFFPDDRILSHDIIEGAVLRSTSLKRCVYEDAPKTFAADMARTIRWQRGDVQLLSYAFRDRVKTKDGSKIKNPIDPIYKLVIFINGMSVLAASSVALVVVLGILFRISFLWYYAASIYLSAYVFTLIDEGRSLFRRIRFRHAVVCILNDVRNLADRVFLMPVRAVLGLYVFIVTGIKILFHSKDLLSWTPFRTTQRENGMNEGAVMMLPAYIVLCAFAAYVARPLVLLYALCSGLYLIAVLISGRKREKGVSLDEERGALLAVAKDIYRFFQDEKNDGLITDNLQLFPCVMRSKMTSPTNIGFSILAEVSACKLGIVDGQTALAGIASIIAKTERLEKWHGHLYNWYNVTTFEPMMPKVVSTVDSSNFLACLIVAENFAKEEGDFALSERIAAIVDATDYTPLIRAEDHMLAIVYDLAENALRGKYDLLASEARLAYLIAIAKGCDPKGYFSLGRDCIGRYGNTLLSWSGTAFEYMLPRIFVKAPRGSLIAAQERNSGRMQMTDEKEGLFGRSECGYRDFDNSTAYKYKAVGVRALALSGEGADVISPYATFLYLPCFPKECVRNLTRLKERGLQGEYGFYEAIDLEQGGEIVKSFMAHHQGMSLAAIANALTDDSLVRAFSSDPMIRAVRLLSAEENEYRLPPKVYPSFSRKEETREEAVFLPHEPAELYWDRSEEYAFAVDSLGRGYSKFGDRYVTKFSDYKREKGGIFFQIKENETLSSPSYYPSGDDGCFAAISEGSIRYCRPDEGLFLECRLLQGYNGELRKLVLRNDTDEVRKAEVSVYADVVLNTEDGYASHPAFSDMFVRAEYDDVTDSAVLYRKNERCEIAVAALLSVKGLEDVRYNCNRYNVYGRTRSRHDDISVGVACTEETPFGDVLYPCFAASGKVEVPPHSEATVYCYLLAGKDPTSVRTFSERLDSAYKTGILDLLGRKTEKEGRDLGYAAKLGGALLYAYPSADALRALREHEEIRKTLSEKEKIVYLEVKDAEEERKAFETAVICKKLRDVGVKNRLVIAEKRIEGAGADSLDRLRNRLSEADASATILDLKDAAPYQRCALIDLTVNDFMEYPAFDGSKERMRAPVEIGGVKYTSGEGAFIGDGYRVIPFAENTLLPYANVIGGKEGGFVITEEGGGFTFGKNSREDKRTIWTGDAVENFPAERVYLLLNGDKYRLNAENCTHKVGSTCFESEVEGRHVLLNVYPIDDGATKVYEVIVSGEPFAEMRVSCELYFALDWKYSDEVLCEEEGGAVRFLNVRTGKTCVISASEPLDVKTPALKHEPFILSFRAAKGVMRYRLAIGPDVSELRSEKEVVLSKATTVRDLCKNAITVDSGNFSLDILYNVLLPYQVQSARLFAKTGFSQCGGATGFRDQLQDTLSLLISDPKRVREQILLSAAHQYEEGDVQHWWHEPHIGVRTRISDDKLWLAYVTAKYISVTEDRSVLDEKVNFLSSAPLGEHETSRYEIPSIGESAPLSEHILRAIRNALRYGEHDLLKIGTGDWNDGLDRVGAKGRGESVWLTMFACAAIGDCIAFYPTNVRKELSEHLGRMKSALKSLLKGGRYPLCFTDDGKWLGYEDTPDCTLSLNPQTWSILSGALPAEDALTALGTAKELVDPFAGIVKLSAPPFDEKSNYGYISAYPKGVRENGGQYTHAAVWYLKALLEARKGDEAYKILLAIDPVEKCRDKGRAAVYKGEPYVLSGDVYGYEDRLGRAGWSWYTGSAAWLKYTLTEDFFGIKKRGNKLYIRPCFPSSFRHATCKIRVEGKCLTLEYLRGEEERLSVDGKKEEFVDLRELADGTKIVCYFT